MLIRCKAQQMLRRMLRAITGHKQPEVMIYQGRISWANWEKVYFKKAQNERMRATADFRERSRGDRPENIQVLRGRRLNAITANKCCSPRLVHVSLEKLLCICQTPKNCKSFSHLEDITRVPSVDRALSGSDKCSKAKLNN